MTDSLKIERIVNPDGSVTIQCTEDISSIARRLREEVLAGRAGMIYNIGPNKHTVIVASPPRDGEFVWKKVRE